VPPTAAVKRSPGTSSAPPNQPRFQDFLRYAADVSRSAPGGVLHSTTRGAVFGARCAASTPAAAASITTRSISRFITPRALSRPHVNEEARPRFPTPAAGMSKPLQCPARSRHATRMENPLPRPATPPLPADPSLARRTGVAGSAHAEPLRGSRARPWPQPSFATPSEPLEALQHRVSRTWSPVSHLNAVLNSDALRSAYTHAALCCPPTYRLAQSGRVPAYRTSAAGKVRARPVQRHVIEHAMRDFRLSGVGLPAQAARSAQS